MARRLTNGFELSEICGAAVCSSGCAEISAELDPAAFVGVGPEGRGEAGRDRGVEADADFFTFFPLVLKCCAECCAELTSSLLVTGDERGVVLGLCVAEPAALDRLDPSPRFAAIKPHYILVSIVYNEV